MQAEDSLDDVGASDRAPVTVEDPLIADQNRGVMGAGELQATLDRVEESAVGEVTGDVARGFPVPHQGSVDREAKPGLPEEERSGQPWLKAPAALVEGLGTDGVEIVVDGDVDAFSVTLAGRAEKCLPRRVEDRERVAARDVLHLRHQLPHPSRVDGFVRLAPAARCPTERVDDPFQIRVDRARHQIDLVLCRRAVELGLTTAEARRDDQGERDGNDHDGQRYPHRSGWIGSVRIPPGEHAEPQGRHQERRTGDHGCDHRGFQIVHQWNLRRGAEEDREADGLEGGPHQGDQR